MHLTYIDDSGDEELSIFLAFIQLSDFCAYALLCQERPIASKTKYGLDQAFDLLKPISQGVIRPDA